MNVLRYAILIAVLSLAIQTTLGETYHISPNGNDLNSGSFTNPWKSLNSINRLKPGDVVVLHGKFNGFVEVNISGLKGKPIKIVGDNATIDGSGVLRDGVVLKPNVSYIEIENLHITNFSNHWGLALYGSNRNVSINNVEIDRCEVGIHLTVGDSGKKPWYGDVRNIKISNVYVHNNSIAGLDCTPGPCYNLSIVDSSFTYNGKDGFGADGIAIESGNRILIKNVTSSFNAGDGIDLLSRNPLLVNESVEVVVRESIISNNGLQGLKLWKGGKVVNCLIHSNGLEGLVVVYNGDYIIQNCDIVRNALLGGYAFTSGYPEVDALDSQNKINLTIQNTIFAFNGKNPTGLWVSDNFTSQNCVYYDRDFEEVYINKTAHSVTRDEINSGYLGLNYGVDPKFVSLTDFHLTIESPCVDSGIPTTNVDLEYNSRPWGEGYDIGCYELIYQIIKNITPSQAYQLIKTKNVTILDVRTPREFYSGHLPNAINIDFYSPTFKYKLSKLDKNKAYLIYCRTGHRSGIALKTMKELGFMEVYNMLGGITRWKYEGYPVVR